ncbi:MAG: hypothetical protein CR981_03180 [Proteobacteria bacterium]|nr:MAG: hypothetical protein CR981_03180 [Pseudomonadota bacterium]
MNRFLLIVFICFSMSYPGSDVGAAEKEIQGALLESISYEKNEHDLEKIVFKLNGMHIPKIFKIKGERPRLVFDFIDTRYSKLINNIINTEGGLIKGVRVGLHNDPPKTRVVVDLQPEGNIDFEQDFQVQKNVLSITFHASDAGKKEKMKKAAAGQGGSGKINKQSAGKSSSGRKKEAEVPGAADEMARQKEKTVRPSVPAGNKGPGKNVLAVAESGSADTEKLKTASDENPILAQLTEEKPIPVEPIVKDVSFETTANDSEMVLFKLNEFYPPIVFGIEKGNPRVVCDFLDTDLADTVKSVIQTNGVYVSRIRTALHTNPHKVRVVLDLVPNRNYDLQQVFFKEDNLFVIIINKFEEEPLAVPDTSPAVLTH